MPLALLLCSSLCLAAPADCTYALRWPVTPETEPVLTARLPQWEQLNAFGRYALPVNPPSTGADPDYDAALLGRLASQLGRSRLVAVTPPVGTVGWETSNNGAFIPLGGRPVVLATPRDEWFAYLAALPVDELALWYTQPQREPTGREFGAYLDSFLGCCGEVGRRATLWLPAGWWAGREPSALVRELTAERLAGFEQVVLTEFAAAVETLVKAQRRGAAEAESGSLADLAAQVVATARLLSRVTGTIDRARLVVELVDEPRGYARDAEALGEYVAQLQAEGLTRFVVRGRLDTPQAAPWQALWQAWGQT